MFISAAIAEQVYIRMSLHIFNNVTRTNNLSVCLSHDRDKGEMAHTIRIPLEAPDDYIKVCLPTTYLLLHKPLIYSIIGRA